MKTVLTRLKALAADNATLKGYVAKNEIVAPGTIPLLSHQDVPFIAYAPINSPEQWVAQHKEVTHTVEAYLVQLHTVREEALIGSDNDKGILDFVADYESAIRGSFLPDPDDSTDYYLSKPLDITAVDYSTEPYGDGFYLLVAIITLSCIRLFTP